MSPILPCTVSCISWATITCATRMPRRWNSVERDILRRLAIPDPYRRPARGLNPTPDSLTPDSRSHVPIPDAQRTERDRASRSSHGLAGGGRAARGMARARHAHPVWLEGCGDARRPRTRPHGRAAGIRLLADRSRHAQEYPRPARMPDRERHGAARRHRRRAAGHHHRRTGHGVRRCRPFAARRLQRHARRSDRHGPHPRSGRVHGRTCSRRPGRRQRARAAAAGRH